MAGGEVEGVGVLVAEAPPAVGLPLGVAGAEGEPLGVPV